MKRLLSARWDRLRRLCAAFCTTALLLAPATTASAETQPTENEAPALLLNQSVVNGVPMVSQSTQNQPNIVSRAAVVMDMTTGTVVYAKNPNEQHYPASITKIMTAMIALQRGHLSDSLTASELASRQPADSLELQAGEQEPLNKLLYGLLLFSANDAAVVIAEHYGGSVSGFAQMMNNEARQLGATHTHFVNANGLPDTEHVTTAYDMSLITRAAMQIPDFRQIVRTKTYNWTGQKWQTRLINLNKMLFNYPGAIGVKTGFTSAAHQTLVVAATRGQQTYLAVLMDAPSPWDIRTDATKILDFSFAHFHSQVLVQQGTAGGQVVAKNGERIPVVAGQTVAATLPVGQDIHAIQKTLYSTPATAVVGTTPLGQLKLYQGTSLLCSVPLIAAHPRFPTAAHAAEDTSVTSATRMRNIALVSLVAAALAAIVLRQYFKRKQRTMRPFGL